MVAPPGGAQDWAPTALPPPSPFLERQRAARNPEPADCVLAVAPLMHRLLKEANDFLRPEHLRADPNHYARNAIYIPEDRSLSLFALVWSPGQWTPVHDHGSWGVVGVLKGVLEERNYFCTDYYPSRTLASRCTATA